MARSGHALDFNSLISDHPPMDIVRIFSLSLFGVRASLGPKKRGGVGISTKEGPRTMGSVVPEWKYFKK